MIAFNPQWFFWTIPTFSLSISINIQYILYSIVRPRGCAICTEERRGKGEAGERDERSDFYLNEKAKRWGCGVWGAGPWQAFYT